MAKTKQDYIDQGRADALAGKPRAALAAGNWQAGAYDKGYGIGVAEAQAQIVTNAAQREGLSIDTRSVFGAATKPGEMLFALTNPTLRAVSSHVLDLLKRADAATPEKALRYRAKAEIVFNRHAYA